MNNFASGKRKLEVIKTDFPFPGPVNDPLDSHILQTYPVYTKAVPQQKTTAAEPCAPTAVRRPATLPKGEFESAPRKHLSVF